MSAVREVQFAVVAVCAGHELGAFVRAIRHKGALYCVAEHWQPSAGDEEKAVFGMLLDGFGKPHPYRQLVDSLTQDERDAAQRKADALAIKWTPDSGVVDSIFEARGAVAG